jgi:SpoVK/Ycf46/Vps4 family AAA+-type ATPase
VRALDLTNWRKYSLPAGRIRRRTMRVFRRRLLASFLSWMQNRKAPVFVAATCNNLTVLPPELIRKLAERKRNPSDFDLDKVAAAAKGYSGAEIDAAVQGGLYAADSEKKPLSTQSLLDALAQTVPLPITRAEEIQTLREWAKTRAVGVGSRCRLGYALVLGR